MVKQITPTEIITAIVAVYAACLSTFIFIKEQSRYKRKVCMKMNFGFLTYEHGISEQMLLFDIYNPGYKSVTIVSPKLTLPDRKNLYFPSIGSNFTFPYTIEEGKNILAWVPLESLKGQLIASGYHGTIILKGSIEDQSRNVFKSKNPVKIDLRS